MLVTFSQRIIKKTIHGIDKEKLVQKCSSIGHQQRREMPRSSGTLLHQWFVKPQLSSCYRRHENAKKRVYDQRIREVEHSSFVPLVMSVTGGLGRIATTTYKRLASMLKSTIFHHHGMASMSSVIFSSSCIRSRYQGGSLFFRTFRQIFCPCRPCDC